MSLKDKIKQLFIERNPNCLTVEKILSELPTYPSSEIEAVLEELVDKEKFLRKVDLIENNFRNDLSQEGYRLTDDYIKSCPVQKELYVAGVKFCRVFDGNNVSAEDVNSMFLVVGKIIEAEQKRLTEQFENERKKYYGSIVTIFGLFVAVFSLINTAQQPINHSCAITKWDLFFMSFINIFPLVIVLFGFSVFLWCISKK